MHAHKIPTAVRLLGFGHEDARKLVALLDAAPRSGPLYACLHDDSLQEPDIVLADGANPEALAWLEGMRCAPPALVIGGAPHGGYDHLDLPFEPEHLYETLTQMLAERRRALALLIARGEPFLAERRRRPRLGRCAGLGALSDHRVEVLPEPRRGSEQPVLQLGKECHRPLLPPAAEPVRHGPRRAPPLTAPARAMEARRHPPALHPPCTRPAPALRPARTPRRLRPPPGAPACPSPPRAPPAGAPQAMDPTRPCGYDGIMTFLRRPR